VAKCRRGDNQKKRKKRKKGGGAGATHIYTHNFVARNLIRGAFKIIL